MSWASEFFQSNNFMPHGHCYLWRPDILWLNVGSDVLIAMAYYSIPFFLLYFAIKRKDFGSNGIFVMFALFIFACGTTHLFAAYTVWNPEYGTHGLIKLATAGISLATAIALFPLMPKALKVPSPYQLQLANKKLQKEVHEKEKIESELRKMQRRLEVLVEERTSDLSQAVAELKSAKEQAEQASQAKSSFLAHMSHEIRTPLGVLMGCSEMLGNEDLKKEERRELGQAVERNGKLLSAIIDDILDLSKVEAGKLVFRPESTSTVELLRDLESSFALQAQAKGFRFAVAQGQAVPDYVMVDVTRVRQILFNLVSNAIKFTEAGEVVVTTSYQDNCLSFEVLDTGVGLSPKQQEEIFLPFTQADEGRSRRHGGTGLGLTLAKTLAQAMGGDVSIVASAPSEGSRFLARIHAPISSQTDFISGNHQANVAAVVGFKEGELAGRSVLVVDDVADNQFLVQRMLRKTGAKVVLADSGYAALDELNKNTFDVILLDIQMPGMDGFETLKKIREQGFDKKIVALTAHSMAEERERCLREGFDDHVAKPINSRLLLEKIKSFVG